MLYQSRTFDMQMAPNTNFSYPISLNGEAVDPGEYVLEMDVYGDANPEGEFVVENNNSEEKTFEHKWQFSKEFTVTAKEAKQLNDSDVTVENSSKQWVYYAIGGLLLLIILLLVIILRNRKTG